MFLRFFIVLCATHSIQLRYVAMGCHGVRSVSLHGGQFSPVNKQSHGLQGDPLAAVATRSAMRWTSCLRGGHPSKFRDGPGSSRQTLENKHMAWQNRNVSGHGRRFGNANFSVGSGSPASITTSSESPETDGPSNSQPRTFKWNVVHYRNRGRNMWCTGNISDETKIVQ